MIQSQEPKGESMSVARAVQAKQLGLMVCSSCYGRLEFCAPVGPFDVDKVVLQAREQCFLCECKFTTMYKLKEVAAKAVVK